MYNEQRKLAAMAEMDQPESLCKRIFRYSEAFEKRAGVDLCELPTEAVEDMIHIHFGKSALETAAQFCKTYVDWCKQHTYRINRHLYRIQVDVDTQIRYTMVASPLHLYRILNDLFPVGAKVSLNVIYRCYFWMAFMGLEKSEALNVKTYEIDFEYNKMIEFDGKSFDIPREAWCDFELACTATQFEYKHPLYTNSVTRDRKPGERLMRGVSSSSITEGSVISALKQLDGTKRSLEYEQIKQSGVYYQLLQMERAGYPINFDNLAMEKFYEFHPDGIEESKFINTVANMKTRIKKSYKEWKEAFNNW